MQVYDAVYPGTPGTTGTRYRHHVIPACLYIRALISGPVSVAGTATGDARRVAPRRTPGGPPEAIFFAIYSGVLQYALIYMREIQATKCV